MGGRGRLSPIGHDGATTGAATGLPSPNWRLSPPRPFPRGTGRAAAITVSISGMVALSWFRG